MNIKTLYIDDDEKDLKKYKQKFETGGISTKFEINIINTPKSLEDYNKIFKESPELILVDFDLTKPDSDGNVIGISGVSLSTELRQKFPDIPIVLFTRKSVFEIKNYSEIEDTLSSINRIIFKNELFKPDTNEMNFLYELAIGFKKLRSVKSKNWNNLMKILNAPDIAFENLKLSNPPISSISKKTWSVSYAAKWIRETLITYPGILYDAVHSATFLGISEDTFQSNQFQKFFNNAKYSGVFTPLEGRWWKSKLQEIADSIMDEENRDLPLREGFPSAWDKNKKTKIKRAKCIVSDKSPAEWVCYILKQPVMIKYSLHYEPDLRPSVMDEARVSFKAIRTSNEVNDDLFDSINQEMLADIRKMPKGDK